MPTSSRRNSCFFLRAQTGKVPISATFPLHAHSPQKTGVQHRKEIQDATIDPSHHYIRTIIDLPDDDLAIHEEDDSEQPASTNNGRTRIIICMTPEASRRLLKAQYLQSDIGFKRIVGFLEFELACMDRDANTSAY